MKTKLSIFTVTLFVFSIIAGCSKSSDTNKNVVNSNVAVAAAGNKTIAANSATAGVPNGNSSVNAANFAKLQNGMSYAETVKILGAEGAIISENDVPGLKTIMYQWNGAGYGTTASLKIVFQNDKIIDKANTGVK